MELGQRVSVDFKEVPEDQRRCTTGTVIAMHLRFPGGALQKSMVKIRFDKNYIKTEHHFINGIYEITLEKNDERITLI